MIPHTPGPWYVDDDDGTQTGRAGCIFADMPGKPDQTVAVADNVYGRSDGEAAANALLIATAPELLAAAKKVVERWSHGDLAGAVNELQGAIHMAEGE